MGFASVAFDRERKHFAPFRDRIAWLWTLFLVWMLVATPFSVWGADRLRFCWTMSRAAGFSFSISPPSPVRRNICGG